MFVTIIWLPILFCGLALMVLWLGALFNTDSGELTFELFQEVVGDAIGFFANFGISWQDSARYSYFPVFFQAGPCG